MYLSGTLEIDPSQVTILKYTENTGIFGQILDIVTLGKTANKIETETFTAIKILHQLNMGLKTADVDNIIKLAIDNHDFFFDNKLIDKDLKQALIITESEIDPIVSKHFEQINLVLEKIDDEMKFLIEIRILRKHPVGEYPIKIHVTGLFPEFYSAKNESYKDIINKISRIAGDNISIEKMLIKKKAHFELFLTKLENSLTSFIQSDGIIKQTFVKLIRPPQERIESCMEIPHIKTSFPVFYGYPGIDNYFYYCWIWLYFAIEYDIKLRNLLIIDHQGRDICSIGNKGFSSSAAEGLNPENDFARLPTDDITYYSNNTYSETINKLGLISLNENENVSFETQHWINDNFFVE